jgi:CRP-like cAMP-binding protein
MSSPARTATPDPAANHLFAALPPDEYARLVPDLAVVHLPGRTTLAAPEEPLDHAYFPLSGVISMTTTIADGAIAEVGTIGNEGFVGMDAFLGAPPGPFALIAQVPGDHARLPLAPFCRAAAASTALHALPRRFQHAFFVLTGQSPPATACTHCRPAAPAGSS